MIFASRRRRGPVRFLNARMILLALGATLALAGMALEIDLLIMAAILVLAAGVALGVIARRGAGGDDLEA